MPRVGAPHAFILAVGVTTMALAAWVRWLTYPRPSADHEAVPKQHRDEEYLGASSCKSCHPGQYASWRRSFHSSMTRRIGELSFDGDAGPRFPVSLSLYGRTFELYEEGNKLLLQGPDLHEVAERLRVVADEAGDEADGRRTAERVYQGVPRKRRELVLATGSHHYLAFWVEGGADQELRQLPFVFLLQEKAWLPRDEAFLQPPEAAPRIERWNANCVQCHSVAGRPGQSEGYNPDGTFWEQYSTDAVDLGIACEACHGPAQRHAESLRDPFARRGTRLVPRVPPDGASQTRFDMFVPGWDEHNRGNQACGQCHSYFLPSDPDEWWQHGFSRIFRAGQDLESSRSLLDPALDARAWASDQHERWSDRQRPEVDRGQELPADSSGALSIHSASLYWDNGAILVGGRELNAVLRSACNKHGHERRKLACTSCHSMHQSEPDHQLKRDFVATANDPTASDRMCLQCHETIPATHSGHAESSPGARCTSCHMPKTSYALLQGVASHFITSPGPVLPPPRNARPPADPGTAPHPCSLCHVDETASWINDHLNSHWNIPLARPVGAPNASDESLPWAVTRALSGNAAERALYAFAFGELPVSLPNGPTAARTWASAVLAQLKSDPYRAIHHIAQRSVHRLSAAGPLPARPDDLEVLLRALHEARDDTPLTISE